MKPRAIDAAGPIAVVVVAAIAAVVSIPIALGVLFLGLLAALATAVPAAALVLSAVVIALVPIYWMPDIPSTHVALWPAAIVSLVLLPMALKHAPEIRFGIIDRLLLLFVVLNAASFLLNASGGAIGSIGSVTLGTLLPYATFRLAGMNKSASERFAVGVVIGGVISAFIAVREYDGWANPFFRHFLHGHQHGYWARADERLSHLRPEASFGQAIPLGMFLALAAVLAVALGWRRGGSVGRRVFFYGSAIAIVLGLVDVLVRGPLLMLGFGIVLVVMYETRRGAPGRGLLLAALLVVLVNVGSFANVFQLRDESFSAGSRVNRSSEYRVRIWNTVTDRAQFSLLGHEAPDPDGVGFSHAQSSQIGLKSIDNYYAYVYIDYGAFALLIFIALGFRVAGAAMLDGLGAIDQAWAAAMLAAFINLMTVSLLTQFTHLFWIGLGLVAAAVQRGRDEATALLTDQGAVASASKL
jgi:hypothetical protein